MIKPPTELDNASPSLITLSRPAELDHDFAGFPTRAGAFLVKIVDGRLVPVEGGGEYELDGKGTSL